MAGCWHLRAEQGVLGRVAGISLAGPGLFCMLSGPGSVPSFQEPAGTVAYSLLGVHWQLALTADPASTSPYRSRMLGVNLCPISPRRLTLCARVPIRPGLCGACRHVTSWEKTSLRWIILQFPEMVHSLMNSLLLPCKQHLQDTDKQPSFSDQDVGHCLIGRVGAGRRDGVAA